MRRAGRAIQFGLVWSAALMTPLSAFAHVECRCPSGQIKLFCFGSPSKSTGCCCGGGECCCKGDGNGTTGESDDKPSCCQGHGPRTTKVAKVNAVKGTCLIKRHGMESTEAASQPHIESASCCQKTVTNAEIVVVTSPANAKESLNAWVPLAVPQIPLGISLDFSIVAAILAKLSTSATDRSVHHAPAFSHLRFHFYIHKFLWCR